MPPKMKFTEGEKVLCFHGPLIYEAKALKSQVTKDKQVKYFIHYAGWNKNWDEWVPENRVLKFNEANVQRQKEVHKVHSTGSAKNKKVSTSKPKKPDSTSSSGKDSDSRASTPSKELAKDTVQTVTPGTASAASSTSRGRSLKPSSSSTSMPNQTLAGEQKDEASKKKRGRIDQTAESEELFLAKVEIKINIPDDLKPWIVDDWDAVNRQQKLLEIPAKTTVQDIINGYISQKKPSKTANQNKGAAITDVTTSLIEYFDVMLGRRLLYKFERPQYADLLKQHPNTPMSALYGSFHLLRLLVKLGTVLPFTTLDEKSVQMLLVHFQDLLKYLVKNSSTLFNMQQFVDVPSEYHRKVQQ